MMTKEMKSLEVKQTRWMRTCVWLPSLVIYCRPRILLCWDNPGLCSSFSHTVPPPPPSLADGDPVSCRAREKERGRTKG